MPKMPLLAACLLGACAHAAQAQTPAGELPRGVTRVATVEGLTEYRLDNGLRAVLLPDPSTSTITVNITYLVGSRHEHYGETGMAHIIEHLVSFGSPRHPDAKREQSERGAQRNASTWLDRTNYYETFPATDANLDWALDLEADRMVNASVRKEILDSQMSVVRNEFEAGENSVARVLDQRLMSTAFLWHNYGKSTIGARSDIEQVPIERLIAFYRRHYRPDNAVMVVSGKFDEGDAVRRIAAKFLPVVTPSTPIEATYTQEPVQDGERYVELRRAGDVQMVMAGYHVPPTAHPDFALLDVLQYVLSVGPSSRLQKALIETRKSAAVGQSLYPLRERGYLAVSTTVRKGASLDAAKQAMLAVLDDMAAQPVTDEETDRAKAQMLAAMDLELANSADTAMTLTEWAAAGDWRLMFVHRDRVRQATAADLRRVASTYLKPSNRTVAVFIPEDSPERAIIPDAPDIAGLVRDYKGDAVLSMGEAFDTSTANIERRMVRSTLENGMRLALLPKKNRGATVTAIVRINFGDESSLRDRWAPATLARITLMRGTVRRTRQQIQDELSRLKAQMSVTGNVGATLLQIQTVGPNVEAVLRLAAEILREPAFPAEEFEQVRQAQLASLENSRTDPAALAPIELERVVNPYPPSDPRYTRNADESLAMIKAVTLDAVKAVHQELYGASSGEVVVIGEVDPVSVQRVASELFGAWRTPKPYAEVKKAYRRTEAARPSVEVKDKANATVAAGQLWPLNDRHLDYPALVLANYMLGGHSASRLYLRIRGKEGLSYGVGSTLTADATASWAQWGMSAITNPVNAPKVIAAFLEEVALALKGGFSAPEVEAAKQGWAESRRVQRNQDALLTARIALNEHNGRTMSFDGDLESQVAALKADDITATLRRHLDPDRLVIVTSGDFEK